MQRMYFGGLLLVASLQVTDAHAQQTLATPPTIDAETGSPSSDSEEDSREGGAHGFLAIGPGVVPASEGAKKYQFVPFMFGNVAWKGLDFQLRGLGARVDVLGDGPLQVGPLVSYRGNRNSDEDASGRAKLLNDVDSSIEVGGFVQYHFGGNEYGQGELGFDLSLAKDVAGGHEGLLGSAQISYAAYRSREFFLSVDAQATFADKKYMRAFFGISPAEAARSGLTAYRPDSGIKDAGAGVTAGYQFNERFGLIARAGANYYLGDAKDSPIVDEGSKLQVIGGLSLSYRF